MKLTQAELTELDRLLMHFGAMVLNKPASGRNAERQREDHFRRVLFVRKLVSAAITNTPS